MSVSMKESITGSKEVQRLHAERARLEGSRTTTGYILVSDALITFTGLLLKVNESLDVFKSSSLIDLKYPLIAVVGVAVVSAVNYLGLEAQISNLSHRLNGSAKHTRRQ